MIEVAWQFIVKFRNVKFDENSIRSRTVACAQADGQTDVNL
jgi:hypothetical protein